MKETAHFTNMIEERGIDREWIDRAVINPDDVFDRSDGTRHYIVRIPEFGNRWLRVIVNISVSPNRFVTAFFDRRLRENYENKS